MTLSDSRRPWSLFILFFIIIVAIATSTVFVLGRLIDITTAIKVRRFVPPFYCWFQKLIDVVNQCQEKAYKEIAIGGDSLYDNISHATDLIAIFNVYNCFLSLLFSRILFTIICEWTLQYMASLNID